MDRVQLLNWASKGMLDKVRLAYLNAKDLNSFCKDCRHPRSGDSLCHVACRNGHVDLLKFICTELAGVNLEEANVDGKRAIHEAAYAGHLDCLAYLLSRGVEVNCTKRGDWTPLMLSCTKRNLCVVKSLVSAASDLTLPNKDGWTCFHIACREGDVNIVTYLFDCDTDIWRTTSKNGRTPLHTAALHGHHGVTRLLLRRAKYDVNEGDCCGTTPLMDAIHGDHVAVAELLLEHGARLTCTDKLNRTMLHAACQANSTNSIRLLMAKFPFEIDSRTVHGSTPLHLSCKEGHLQAVSLLLGMGADADSVDHRGRTALHVACAAQYVECARLLIDHGIRIDQSDFDGLTATDLATTSSMKNLLNFNCRSKHSRRLM